ncbi:uncharacterized protein METZ01_LOCUS52507 [marine metagenome]|uniref:Uncharacterized protein n=1 Tax=marine metagenome TaxID=408172 RepID=A0A381SER8_9ZZZZ
MIEYQAVNFTSNSQIITRAIIFKFLLDEHR